MERWKESVLFIIFVTRWVTGEICWSGYRFPRNNFPASIQWREGHKKCISIAGTARSNYVNFCFNASIEISIPTTKTTRPDEEIRKLNGNG